MLPGWIADYILIREGSTVFNISDLDLFSHILIEPCAVAGLLQMKNQKINGSGLFPTWLMGLFRRGPTQLKSLYQIKICYSFLSYHDYHGLWSTGGRFNTSKQ